MSLERFKVILVEPKTPENIGSTARLLENFHVGSAVLVNPLCEYKTGVAQWVATGSSLARLNALPNVPALKDAIEAENFVVGFTARSGRSRKISIKLEDIAKTLPGKIALVFGRENTCLSSEEAELCTHLCALDTHENFPTLNLSHSVAVVLSQLYRQEIPGRKGHRELATVAEQEPVYEHLREMMIEVGLTEAGNPDRMLVQLRLILARAALTRQDLSLLRGLFARVIAHVRFLTKK